LRLSAEDGEALRAFFNDALGALGTASNLLKHHAPEAELKGLERSREETKALARRVQSLLQRALTDGKNGGGHHG
jgi:hypothetical protein